MMLNLLLIACSFVGPLGNGEGQCKDEGQRSLLQKTKAKRATTIMGVTSTESMGAASNASGLRWNAQIVIFPKEPYGHVPGANLVPVKWDYRANVCGMTNKCTTLDDMKNNWCCSKWKQTHNGIHLGRSRCVESCLKKGPHCYVSAMRIPPGIKVTYFHIGWGKWDKPCSGEGNSQKNGEATKAGTYNLWTGKKPTCAFQIETKPGWRCFRGTLKGPKIFKIHSKEKPELCLDVFGGHLFRGKTLGLWTCKKGDGLWNQAFMLDNGLIRVVNQDNKKMGKYDFVHEFKPLCFNMWECSQKEEVAVKTWSCEDRSCDQWIFAKDMLQVKSKEGLCIGVSDVKKGSELKLTKCSKGLKLVLSPV